MRTSTRKPHFHQESAEKIIWYQCFGTIPPAPSVTEWPGQWRGKESCKPEEVIVFHLSTDHKLTLEETSGAKYYKTYLLHNLQVSAIS